MPYTPGIQKVFAFFWKQILGVSQWLNPQESQWQVHYLQALYIINQVFIVTLCYSFSCLSQTTTISEQQVKWPDLQETLPNYLTATRLEKVNAGKQLSLKKF